MKGLIFVFSTILLLLSLVACNSSGEDGKTPCIQDGYWYIDGVNTGVKAEGADGIDGNGIDKIELTEEGKWLIIFTDGSTQPVDAPTEIHSHIFGETIVYSENLGYKICKTCNFIEWTYLGSVESDDLEDSTTFDTATYDEAMEILDAAFKNSKEQAYWSIRTTNGTKIISEYNKDSASSELADASFDIHHDQSTVAHILEKCTNSKFEITSSGKAINIVVTDGPEGMDALSFRIENNLIMCYTISFGTNKREVYFSYER